MAQIDLAHAKMYLLDGYSLTGCTVDTAGATAGDTAIPITGLSSTIPDGVRVAFPNDDTVYRVVSSTGGATPTQITISPALAADVSSGDTVTIGPNELLLVIGEGNLTWNEKQNMEYVRNYRKISFVRQGDEDPTDVSFDLIWEYLSSQSSNPPTPYEALKQLNNASSWVTSGSDACEPYSVDVEVEYIPPCSATGATEYIKFKEFRQESIQGDVKQGTLSVSGKCKVTAPVLTRV